MFDITSVRSQFPALSQQLDGRPVVFLDNPGGTQCPSSVISAVSRYYSRDNANHGGVFATSVRSDVMLAEAHQAAADLLGAASAKEVAFGANMTTLTFSVSRALGRRLSPGDELVVTHLDHDANIAPWLMMAEDRGAVVRWVDIHPEDCTLDLESFARQLSPKTKIVAVGYASNAVGTINDVGTIVKMAHEVGAIAFVDAVQYAPHSLIDVQAVGCDMLACSAYKFFGPHVGLLWGRLDLLESLTAYKVRPAGNQAPDKFETGTLNHEGIAGTLAAIEYLASLQSGAPGAANPAATRRQKLAWGFELVETYERMLCARLLNGLAEIDGVRVWGIADPRRARERVPTVSITFDRVSSDVAATRLADAGIFVYDGHFYALALYERLGLEPKGGFVRLGLAHYNTTEEIDRVLAELTTIAKG
jgi:cysteine desulfurase family protein (TIGR01976 family)